MADSRHPPRRRTGRLLIALLLLGGGLALAGWQLLQGYQDFSSRPLVIGEDERTITVSSGDSFRDVLREIRLLGVQAGHDLEWELLAWQLGVVRRLQVGEYAVGHGITPEQLLRKLEQGSVIQHRFTIIEGTNWRELRAQLADEPALVQTIGEMSDAQLLEKLGSPELPTPEGQFLPETYHYTRGVTDFEVLQRAHRALQAYLEKAWPERDEDLPLQTPQEALVLASIIEKETGVPEERPTIAGVFVRRLDLGMKLQTDPTVIYGVGEAFDGNLTRAHLTTDTPYNTYTRFGLPPAPIAMAGKAAIHAALHPAEGDALYFVSRGDGSHVFSRTLGEHNRAVRQYQLRR